LKTYTATLYEKAEHWTLDVTIRAETIEQAWIELRKNYPARHYSVHREPYAYHQL